LVHFAFCPVVALSLAASAFAATHFDRCTSASTAALLDQEAESPKEKQATQAGATVYPVHDLRMRRRSKLSKSLAKIMRRMSR
jgi:hypothetical protein